jgi:NADH-quinone oxidoreductase subunit L
MKLDLFLNFFILLPLAGFLISLVLPSKLEKINSRFAYFVIGAHWIGLLGFLTVWFVQGRPVLNIKDFVLFSTPGYEFFVDFYFDEISAVYLFVGAGLTFLVTIYSRYYLHREQGFKRFFNTILFFYLGYCVIILSGNLETMFIGWEILGVSSFLLIAFYRDRYLPVRNAVKVFSIYRLGDVGLILAMWMSHHLWHENTTFLKLSNYELVHHQLQSHTLLGVVVSLMILVSAAIKSAQLPFSSWLPRAMEGPTPSSAIFYGSLSVHIGVFVLLRTFPFWEHQISVRILIGLLGLVTSIAATGIARVQSSIKSQIAYSSIAQIGLIFIEVALGLEYLALIHFAGNAFLRTYQLLVSPSVVSYLIREQFFNFKPRTLTVEDSLPKRLEYSYYVFCLKEWNLDSVLYRFFWNPLKLVGSKLDFLSVNRALLLFGFFLVGGLLLIANQEILSETALHYLPIPFSILGVVAVLKAFTERQHARLAWVLTILNHFCIVVAISFNEHFGVEESLLYLSGVVVAGFVGWLCLRYLKMVEGSIDLDRFHGYAFTHRLLALVFLLCSLSVAGFPISPTFIGEDLLFSHIHENQVLLAFLTAVSLIVNGLAIIRIYARIFLGPHVKSVYDMGYRSS